MKIWDSVIVGAGASGLMAAITAAGEGVHPLLLDSRENIGAKILMSGGTRCNVTHQHVTDKDYESGSKRTVSRILEAFPPERTIRFFRELGVELVLEPGGKYFPVTHSARTVLNALVSRARHLGVELHAPRKVSSIRFDGGYFQIDGKHFSYAAKTVVLATGGLSYPQTGSDGTGYALARALGHPLVAPTPALTPLLTADRDWHCLAGVSLAVRLTLWVDGKKKISFEDGFLFTHFGFSGPSALDMSRHWIHWKNAGAGVSLTADFLPLETEAGFREKLEEAVLKSPRLTVKNFLARRLPGRFTGTLLAKIKIPEALALNQLTRGAREALIRSLFHFPLEITGVYGYKKAEVTAGGVDLARIDARTLESKIQPGLFFAGEILDADGRIGGFNFQWAWSSGFLAGRGAAKKVLGRLP